MATLSAAPNVSAVASLPADVVALMFLLPLQFSIYSAVCDATILLLFAFFGSQLSLLLPSLLLLASLPLLVFPTLG